MTYQPPTPLQRHDTRAGSDQVGTARPSLPPNKSGSPARSALQTGDDQARRTPDRAALGTFAKSVGDGPSGAGQEARNALRSARIRQTRKAARLASDKSVSKCLMTPRTFRGVTGVETKRNVHVVRDAETGASSFRDLHTCGNVWLCPVCSSKISRVRQGELNEALRWAREQNRAADDQAERRRQAIREGREFSEAPIRHVAPMLLTLTIRHHAGERLGAVFGDLLACRKRWQQRAAWRKAIRPEIAGSITAQELTHGRNGWHPHVHMLVFVYVSPPPIGADPILAADHMEADARAILERARADWHDLTMKAGRRVTGHGFDIQGAAQAGRYVAKWGAAEELTLGTAKAARDPDKGRTPWDLLAEATDGDERAGHLWREYAEVFSGRRQLVWSPGFKAMTGVAEVSDEEAAEGDEGADPAGVAALGPDAWRVVRRHECHAAVLDAAEAGGLDAVRSVLVGLTQTPEEAERVARAVSPSSWTRPGQRPERGPGDDPGAG